MAAWASSEIFTLLADTLEQQTDERAALPVQRTKLGKRARKASSLDEFLVDVGYEQIATQMILPTN